MFFLIKFHPYFFCCYLFWLLQVFIDIFSLVSFFNILLVENWAYLFNPDPRFHGLWFLEVRSGLKGLPELVCFFFFFLRWCFFIFFFVIFYGLPIIIFQFHLVSFVSPWMIHEIINVFQFHPNNFLYL
jgi:hypothetical protein